MDCFNNARARLNTPLTCSMPDLICIITIDTASSESDDWDFVRNIWPADVHAMIFQVIQQCVTGRNTGGYITYGIHRTITTLFGQYAIRGSVYVELSKIYVFLLF